MSLLNRKLWRDIGAMRGQVITIALLVAAGVAVFVGSVSTYQSLRAGCELFYAEARFPQVFVTLKRAPLTLVARLNAVAGVLAAEPRIVREVIVDAPAAAQPVSARLVSLSRAGDEPLARLHLRRGTAPAPPPVTAAATSGAAAPDEDLDRLSAREREVMRLIARGYTYREAGAELFISDRTVETHVSSVLRKLQLSNRHELTRWAARRGYA